MIDRSCNGQQCTGWQVSNTCHATLFLFFVCVFQARLVISDLLLVQFVSEGVKGVLSIIPAEPTIYTFVTVIVIL